MYPRLDIIPWLPLYTFGLAMSIAFLLFFFLMYHGANRAWVQRNIFTGIVSFSIAILLFWRLFYILAEWREFWTYFSDIRTHWKDILLMKDYSISLMGGILGFMVVFFFRTYDSPRDRKPLLDVVTLSFFIPAIIGYIGAFFGGQIYGKSSSWFGITPDPEYAWIGFAWPIFPLALLYAIGCLLIFLFLFALRQKKTYHWFITYVGMSLFWAMLFLGEFLNGSSDMFQGKLGFTLSQIGWLIFLLIGIIGIFRKLKV